PIRAYVEHASAERLAAEMGPSAADISEIIPEVRAKLPDLGTPPALEPGPARFRLFDSITTFLKNAAQSQPLMLVLDDLHWADRSSLLLLEFMGQEIGNSPLLLVGAHRAVKVSRGHPLSHTLGALVREQLFHRVQLDGLTQQEVWELVERNAGITLTPEAAEVVHSRTDGNPFFVGEVTRQVTLENITQDDEWAIIPEGVRDAIGRRLNRLSDQCNHMLTTASIIGREFDFRLLIILSGGVSEDQLLQAVDEALSVHLIEDVRGQMDRYQFSHALIQETLSEELSTSRRVRLRARIAEALEALYGDDGEAHAAELAHHFAEAQTSTGITKLVRYSLLAGEQALAAYAWDEALAHFERGLVARDITLSGTEAPTDDEAAALLFGLARARVATVEEYQLGEAFATLSRAFEYYAEAGNVAQAVAAAEFPIATPGYLIPGLAELMARALTLVPADSHEAGRLLSRYGGILGAAESDYEGAQQALGRAISIARREGDVVLEVKTLTYAAIVSGRHLHWQESIDH
ncbi:MAG: AAA family ATPase, partial [Stenotrophomonas maltophilia]